MKHVGTLLEGLRRAAADVAAARIDGVTSDGREIAEGAKSLAPIVWLIGKVQSGKTSIVRAVTQSSNADVGNGFRPCTRTARIFDFPSDAPVLRFLDTRGLGEVAYDPADDLAFAEAQAHLLLVTMRATDAAQESVIEAVAAARSRHPAWPVVVAQTCLHEGYELGRGHVLPYPFAIGDPEAADAAPLPADLLRGLRHQRSLLARLPGGAPVVFVPVDLTTADDAMHPADYGLEALADAMVRVAPDAMRAALEALPGVSLEGRMRTAEPVIVGHAMAAAGSDLVPAVGAVAVSAVQIRMLQRVGQICGSAWDRRAMGEFMAALGAGVAARTLFGFGVRQLAKLVPGYGQTVAAATSAATSFAVTYAMGKAAVYFVTRRQRGQAAEPVTAIVYQEALRQALRMARERKLDTKAPDRTP